MKPSRRPAAQDPPAHARAFRSVGPSARGWGQRLLTGAPACLPSLAGSERRSSQPCARTAATGPPPPGLSRVLTPGSDPVAGDADEGERRGQPLARQRGSTGLGSWGQAQALGTKCKCRLVFSRRPSHGQTSAVISNHDQARPAAELGVSHGRPSRHRGTGAS